MSAIRGKIFFKSFWHLLSRRSLKLTLVLIIVLSAWPRQVSTAQAGWQWYKTDTHIHSSVSGDAYVDLGVLSNRAKAAGYNALFVTDHNLASEFPANGVANHMLFEDSYLHWSPSTYGVLTATINELVGSPVNTGSKSLHLSSASGGSAETSLWAVRGPNFRSGDIILKVSIYPTRIDAGSGIYVSASIGGDPRVTTAPAPSSPVGYTTQAGVISPGKSTLLVWQLGSARADSSDPNARVLTYSLGPYTLNTWNHYTINISNYLANIPVADRPLDYNGLTYLKMAAAANGGTAEAYFDTYFIDASAPVSPGDEFVYRNSLIHAYDTSSFKLFPSLEMGETTHSNRFDFGILSPAQFVSYKEGVDGILPTQLGGYPAQLNHPDSPGGVTGQEAIDSQGFGADFMEVSRHQEWINIWDSILNQGVQLLGTGSTDKHTASYSTSSDSTYIYAPALDFDLLVRSYFEGRAFAASGFTGPAVFNLDSTSQEPYPARYPVYVSDTQSDVNVHLVIPSGTNNGYLVNWVRNGTILTTDTVTGTSFDKVKTISLAGATTYVRAEVRSAGNAIRALTQPIFFRDVPGLPSDKRFYVDSVITADGRGYTRVITKGITSATWNSANQTLSLTLENATGSLVRLLMRTSSSPQQILINGAVVSPASSLTTFEAATGSSWYFDNATATLYLKVKHSSGTASVVTNFSSTPITPVTPTPTNTTTPTVTPTNSGGTIFADVGTNYWARTYIERLYAAGITGGCGTSPLRYCPTSPVTRAQMAIFLLRAEHGSSYVPPAARGTVFQDVSAAYWAAAWIEQLSAEGITGGCGSGRYCPEGIVSRDQMAIFLLRVEHGSGYMPPPGSGSLFGDVPSGYWAGAWIEQLVAEGIAAGCGNGNYCPTTSVTRDQMAVFLVRAFHLP